MQFWMCDCTFLHCFTSVKGTCICPVTCMFLKLSKYFFFLLRMLLRNIFVLIHFNVWKKKMSVKKVGGGEKSVMIGYYVFFVFFLYFFKPPYFVYFFLHLLKTNSLPFFLFYFFLLRKFEQCIYWTHKNECSFICSLERGKKKVLFHIWQFLSEFLGWGLFIYLHSDLCSYLCYSGNVVPFDFLFSCWLIWLTFRDFGLNPLFNL